MYQVTPPARQVVGSPVETAASGKIAGMLLPKLVELADRNLRRGDGKAPGNRPLVLDFGVVVGIACSERPCETSAARCMRTIVCPAALTHQRLSSVALIFASAESISPQLVLSRQMPSERACGSAVNAGVGVVAVNVEQLLDGLLAIPPSTGVRGRIARR